MKCLHTNKRFRLFLWMLAGACAVQLAAAFALCRRAGSSWALGAVISLAGLFAAGLSLAALHRERLFLRQLEALIQGADPEETLLEAEQTRRLSEEDLESLRQLAAQLEEYSVEGALKTEAELHALQNQINPHFLYNTLEIIRSRALGQGNSDVAEMVESLALQFRYCINRSGEMATLQEELDHVRNYLLIQHYRFGDHFRYQEVIDSGDDMLLGSKLPVMTLQPIVENALIHGVNPRVEGGCITLRVWATSRRLHIAIEDDGVGISEEDLQLVRRALLENTPASYQRAGSSPSLGIAMRNVNQRIRFYFGENYGVDITSTWGVGTSVFVTLPLLCADGGERTP